MKFKHLQYLLFCIAFYACKQEGKVSKAKSVQSSAIQVDSFVFYNHSNYNLNDFVFSPLNEANKIWLSGNPCQELDLVSGKFRSLYSVWGLDKNSNYRNKKNIVQDTFGHKVFVLLKNKGFVTFHLADQSSTFVEMPEVSMIFPTPGYVVLAFIEGYALLDRESTQISDPVYFPLDINIHNIRLGDGHDLLLNDGKVRFNLITKKSSTGEAVPREPDYPGFDNALFNSITKNGGGKPYLVKDNNVSWCYNTKSLYYSQDGSSVYQLPNLPSEEDRRNSLRSIEVDNDNIYLLFNKTFAVFNKEYIFQNSKFYDPMLLQSEMNIWHKGLALFSDETQNLESIIMHVDSIQKLNLTSRKISQNIKDLPHQFFRNNRVIGRIRSACETALANNSLEEKYKYPIGYGLIKYYTQQANLNKALEIYESLKPIQGTYSDEYTERGIIPLLTRVKDKIDSINTNAPTEDERLFKIGQQRNELMQIGWFGENHYDRTIVFEKYREVLEKYPNGDFADNAAYQLLHEQIISQEGYTLEDGKLFEKFLSDYPQSELKSQVYLELIALYMYPDNTKEVRELHLQKCLELIQRMDTTLLSETEKRTFELNKNGVFNELQKLRLELKMEPENSKLSLSGPISFNLTLKNISKHDVQINAFGETTPIGVMVTNRLIGIEKITSQEAFEEFSSIEIKSGEELTIPIDLSNQCNPIFTNQWSCSNYQFKKPGIYSLAFYSRDGRLSKSFKFELIE